VSCDWGRRRLRAQAPPAYLAASPAGYLAGAMLRLGYTTTRALTYAAYHQTLARRLYEVDLQAVGLEELVGCGVRWKNTP
jgi:hypothetical protein